MADLSRSSVEFLRRHGRLSTPPKPHPRLDPEALRLGSFPLGAGQRNAAYLVDAEGDPPPDRGKADVWIPPVEVSDEQSTESE